MSVAVELARREWEEGHARLDAEVRAGNRLLLDALETVTDELRRRVGQTFTLDELARAYDGAETWVRDALAERALPAGWVRHLTTVQDAAFYLYARGATDYQP